MDLQYGKSVAEVKEQGATTRKLMETTAKAHNTETMAEVKVNDQNTRAITSQNKTEIDAIVRMLIANLDTRRLEEEINRRNAEQYAYAQMAQEDISNGANPLVNAPTQQPAPQAMQAQEPMQQSEQTQPMQGM
jgi:hypothetical protein